MAVVTYPDGRVFEIADGDRELADYYRGEGATISGDLAAVEFPRVYDGGDAYVGEEPAQVESVVVDDQGETGSGEQQAPATGEPFPTDSKSSPR